MTPAMSRTGADAALRALVYELLDAHLDTIELAQRADGGRMPPLLRAGGYELAWRAHLDYLRALERTGRALLAVAAPPPLAPPPAAVASATPPPPPPPPTPPPRPAPARPPAAPPMRERPAPVSDAAVLIGIALALAVCGLVWLWGGLAGALFGRGWTSSALPELLEVLVRLPTHLGHPAAAWPAAARPRLPGTLALYLTLLALLTTAVAILRSALRLTGALGRGNGAGARWAGACELRTLRRGGDRRVRRPGRRAERSSATTC